MIIKRISIRIPMLERMFPSRKYRDIISNRVEVEGKIISDQEARVR
jgi:hypothetical protein